MPRTLVYHITCNAPRIVFTAENYDDMPAVERVKIDLMHGLGCDGGGVEGEWCLRHNCVYAKHDRDSYEDAEEMDF
jgi:hypothetical protein